MIKLIKLSQITELSQIIFACAWFSSKYLLFSESRNGMNYWIPYNIALPRTNGRTLTILVDFSSGLEELPSSSFADILVNNLQVAANDSIIYVIDGDFSDQFNFTSLHSLQILVLMSHGILLRSRFQHSNALNNWLQFPSPPPFQLEHQPSAAPHP
jgi:hypothetical protein